MMRKVKYIYGRACGKSMSPLINEGDELIIYPTSLAQLKFGDIVVYRLQNMYISHRLIWKRGSLFKLKGDNVIFMDRKMSPKKIIGKVIVVKRGKCQLDLRSVPNLILGKLIASWSLGYVCLIWFLKQGLRLSLTLRHCALMFIRSCRK